MKFSEINRILLRYFIADGFPPFDVWFSELSKSLKLNFTESTSLWMKLKEWMKQGFWHQFLIQQKASNSTQLIFKNWEDYFNHNQWDPEVWKTPFDFQREKIVQEILLKKGTGNKLRIEFLKAGFPSFLFSEFEKRIDILQWSDDQALLFLKRFPNQPGLFLRINHPDRLELILRDLEKNDFKVNRISDLTLEVSGKKGIYITESWKQGLIEIQDLSSQQVGDLVLAKKGKKVLDLCAGKGGKTMLLAQKMSGKGAVYALDIKSEKINVLKRRAIKIGHQIIRTGTWNGLELPPFGAEITNQGGFDCVLVDAPCSASGTWNRDPDGAFRLNPRNLLELNKIQKNLILVGWNVLRPGGQLVYSTCSWLPCEDEDTVKLIGESPHLQKSFGPPEQNSSWLFGGSLFKRTTSV